MEQGTKYKLQQELKFKAIQDVFNLQNTIERYEGTLEELCEELKGHNLEEDLFDVNYGCITATVNRNIYDRFYLASSIEVWNDNGVCEGTFEIEKFCRLTPTEFACYLTENFPVWGETARIIDNVCRYAEKWAKERLTEYLFDMFGCGTNLGVSDREFNAVQAEEQEPQYKAIYQGQEYSFDFASKVFIFDTGLSCGFNNQQELLRYVDFVHSCYCKDENETPLEGLARWIVKNWEEVKELPERQVLTKFYTRWANETTDEDD